MSITPTSTNKIGFTVRRRAFVLAVILAAATIPLLRAQSPDDLLPAANAAKAKAILDDAITALGGSAYMKARDLDCQGRIGQFDSGTGAAAGSFDGHFLR